jgi:quercetin dioxygenase-like cupin family protein
MVMEVVSARKAGRIARGSKIRGGCVCLAPGKSVGEHTTGQAEEIVLVLEGEATVIAGGEARTVGRDECVFLPQETVHDVANRSAAQLVYVYFVGGK